MPLKVLSTHNLSNSIDLEHTVICSPHELIAVVTQSHDIVVYRLNGQVAFTIDNSNEDDEEDPPLRVTSAAWSPDGRKLAVAWTDGIWRIHEAEKGDILYESSILSEHNAGENVLGLSWQRHSIEGESSPSQQHILDDFPGAVTLLDVTTVLPRLSALPSHGLRSGSDGAKFSNQPATDSIFAAISQTDKRYVEILMVHISNGSIDVILNGNSHVGTAKGMSELDTHAYASHTSSPSHVLVGHSRDDRLRLEMLDMPLQDLSSVILQSHIAFHHSDICLDAVHKEECIMHSA